MGLKWLACTVRANARPRGLRGPAVGLAGRGANPLTRVENRAKGGRFKPKISTVLAVFEKTGARGRVKFSGKGPDDRWPVRYSLQKI